MQKAELEELLTKAKDLLKGETTAISYDTWIKDLEIQSMENGNVILLVEDSFKKDTVDTRFHDLFVNTFKYLTNQECSVSVLAKDELPNISKEGQTNANQNVYINYSNPTLNSKYTFETFVVGNNNRFAHAAALSVAEAPATGYNPLYIYGGVGLGKTHLMHAIGNEILRRNRNAKILYVSSETFTNELINAIKDGTNEQFHSKYRNIDVLLIDDIQFIAGKKSTQEEFFNTFEFLHTNGKQIILSSDRPPKEINPLEERLRSRFGWGVIADIENADYETRLAILRKKAQIDNIIIDDEILSNIANRVDTNIRDLEGALKKLFVTASLANTPITMEMAERVINELVSSKDKVISSQFIQETVAKYFDVDVKDIAGSKRSADIVRPRQIAMYLCRTVPQLSLLQIGKDFGNRDHTTVMYACDKIEKEIKENKETKLIVESVKKILLSDE